MGYHHRRKSSVYIGGVFLSNPRYYRIITPSAPPAPAALYLDPHAYCVAKDSTYARLNARLERMRTYKATVAYELNEYGRSSGLEPVLKHLEESVAKLEKTLDGMVDKILDERVGSGSGGKVFKVDGKWVKEL